MASRFNAVSSSVSPLLRLDDDTLILTASAESRFAASSNDVRVLVDDSKKRLMTVLPRSAGTFFTSRVEISRKFSAVSRMPVISAAVRSRIPRRSRLLNGFSITKKARHLPCFEALIRRPFEDSHGLDVVKFFQHHLYDLGLFCRNQLADEIGLYRKFAVFAPAIDQNGKLNLSWTSEIHKL